jgi:hypothetical protein
MMTFGKAIEVLNKGYKLFSWLALPLSNSFFNSSNNHAPPFELYKFGQG